MDSQLKTGKHTGVYGISCLTVLASDYFWYRYYCFDFYSIKEIWYFCTTFLGDKKKICKKSESKNYQYPIPFSAELEGHVLT